MPSGKREGSLPELSKRVSLLISPCLQCELTFGRLLAHLTGSKQAEREARSTRRRARLAASSAECGS